jgi:hypothetical protein
VLLGRWAGLLVLLVLLLGGSRRPLLGRELRRDALHDALHGAQRLRRPRLCGTHVGGVLGLEACRQVGLGRGGELRFMPCQAVQAAACRPCIHRAAHGPECTAAPVMTDD